LENLYIIGNGFDIFHDIKSKYSDFRTYVQKSDHNLFDVLEKYFNPEQLWWNFEQELGELDTQTIKDEAGSVLESYSHENWRDSMHHDYQYEIEQKIKILTVTLKEQFIAWILSITIPSTPENKLALRANSVFLNFNYTNTLERSYHVVEETILYIHNKAIDYNSNLILGHNRTNAYPRVISQDPDDIDPRIEEGEKELENYFKTTYKSTNEIMKINESFFDQLNDIQNIFVLGHSLSEVDMPYFDTITKHINLPAVQWFVSIYSINDKKHHPQQLLSLGVPPEKIKIDLIENLDSPQIVLF
jgi:hypothetical protein